jgi:hypothetical protein
LNPPLHRFSSGTRTAGVVIALGYLLGLVPGPVVAVVGALGLITFGRALLLDRRQALASSAALAVTAGALGVGALRWGTLELAGLRGAQSVLGPTVLVGPDQVALASGLALGGALLALGAWLAVPSPRGWGWIWWGIEAATASLAIVTVFFDPARSVLAGRPLADVALEVGRWVGVTAAAVLVAGGWSWLQAKLPGMVRAAIVGLSGAAVLVAAGLVATTL